MGIETIAAVIFMAGDERHNLLAIWVLKLDFKVVSQLYLWTQPTRYMGIETGDLKSPYESQMTQPTRYMGIETC